MKKSKRKGKLIVIDGTDGSGKATQVSLLMEHLKRDGHVVKIVDFPEYYKNFFGAFIGHCLSDQYYNWTHIHPKIASIAYAADRWESSEKMKKWLKEGYIVIANRYVSANQIHQGGKIKSNKKRNDFIKWLEKMEYEVFQVPRPDVTFYLSLPINLVQQLMFRRRKSDIPRLYLGAKKDVHETDIEHLKNARKSALWISKIQKNWKKIECSRRGEILPREKIHEMIYEKVKKVIK